MKRPHVSEKDLERELQKRIKALGGNAVKFRSPMMDGCPDRLVLMPGGRAYFCETKSTGKPLEPLQVYWQKFLRGLGFICEKVDDWESLDKFINLIKSDL